MKKIIKKSSAFFLLFLFVLMLSACKKGEAKIDQAVEDNSSDEVVEILSDNAESELKDGTFFNRAQKQIQKSSTKLLGGSKTISISESGKQNGTDYEEQDNEVVWIPGIW